MQAKEKTVREVEVEVTFRSTWRVTDDCAEQFQDMTEDEIRDEVISLVKPYLESKEGTLYADYGPEAWGGYDGPVYIHGEVTR